MKRNLIKGLKIKEKLKIKCTLLGTPNEMCVKIETLMGVQVAKFLQVYEIVKKTS